MAKAEKAPSTEVKVKKETKKRKQEAVDEAPVVKEKKTKEPPPTSPRSPRSPRAEKKPSKKAADKETEVEVEAVKKPKAKKLKAAAAGDDGTAGPAKTEKDTSLALENFKLSPSIVAALQKKGIASLFPIQAQTLDIVLEGNDLIGRARTGQGKTLAFVLPILEVLAKESSGAAGSSKGREYGRAPRVIVLLPTRELAKQVFGEFEVLGACFNLASLCVYGGAPFPPQESGLKRGVDVVIGTPGRIKDHLERGTLRLNALRFRVLDEADEMLNMGFVDDVETILNAGGAVGAQGTAFQTLLFSATMPDWVRAITERFLKPAKKTVDLVGTSKLKASSSVRHMCLPCHWTQRGQLTGDLVRCFAKGGRTIVFTDTKKDADELAGVLSEAHGARALHGDIAQAQREATLKGFRENKFKVLVATDVAARGLDITGVELVIQCDPPKEPETYIHRSGRTGRANCTGTCVTLYGRLKEAYLGMIERRAGVVFERIGPPQPAQMAAQAAAATAAAVLAVAPTAADIFRAAAAEMLSSPGATAETLLASALAHASGHGDVKPRSLQSSHEDFVTLRYEGSHDVQAPSYVWVLLRRALPESVVGEVVRMTLTADKRGAVFDVPVSRVTEFLAASKPGAEVTRPTELPPLVAPPTTSPGGYGGRGGGRGFGGGRSFGRGGGARGGGRGGRR